VQLRGFSISAIGIAASGRCSRPTCPCARSNPFKLRQFARASGPPRMPPDLLENAMLQRVSRRRIARLAADIDLLDERLLKIVAGDAALAHRYRLLTSMPGVGAVLACAAPLHKRCASLDVHKVEVVACCLISKRKVEREVRVQDLRSQLGQLRSIDDNNGCSKGLRSNSFTGSRAYQPDFHLR
jgi:hypothetical protein